MIFGSLFLRLLFLTCTQFFDLTFDSFIEKGSWKMPV